MSTFYRILFSHGEPAMDVILMCADVGFDIECLVRIQPKKKKGMGQDCVVHLRDEDFNCLYQHG